MPISEKTDAILALNNMLENALISNDRPRAIMKRFQLEVDDESAASI